MEIAYLADHPDHIPKLAAWHHAQWGYLNPESTLATRIQSLTNDAGRCAVPTVFVAIENGEPLGSTSLVVSDVSIRPELTPWLASVYVAEAHRNRGIGSLLVQRIMREAAAIGVETLYLITPDKQNFYARLGWSAMAEYTYRGDWVTQMSVAL